MQTIQNNKILTTPVPPQKAADARLNNFDFLRFLFATVVILSHAKFETVTTDGISHVVRFLGPGRMAVNGFFIISGFLIANSWLHSKGLKDYLTKRILRIYPGLIMALVFCTLIVAPLGGANLATYFQNPEAWQFFRPLILQPNGLVHSVFVNSPHPFEIDGPVWTIRFEIVCYLLLAVMGLCGIFRSRALVLGIFAASCLAFTAQMLNWPSAWALQLPYFGYIDHLPRLVTFFLAGTVFYLYRHEIPHTRVWLAAACALLALTYKFIPSVTVPICGTYILFYVANSHTFRLHRFAKYGDFSYGLYLYAWPVEQLVQMYFGPMLRVGHGLDRIVLFSVTFAITLGLAFLSWRLVEKPCLRLKPRPSAKVPDDIGHSGSDLESPPSPVTAPIQLPNQTH